MAGIDLPGSVFGRVCPNDTHDKNVGGIPIETQSNPGKAESFLLKSDNAEIGKYDPLLAFWTEHNKSPARLIPSLIELDRSWKPLYDELVVSEGYQLIQYFRGAARGLANYIAILVPEGNRNALQEAVIDYLKSADGSTEMLNNLDPNLMQYAKPMRYAIRCPEFHRVIQLVDTISPLIQQSIDRREIVAEELSKDGTGSAMLLKYESSQMRRFIESTQLNGDFKLLVNENNYEFENKIAC